jgi:F420-0:gamma-glutamyl ligase
MQFIPIKTRAFLPPKDNLFELLDTLPKLKERDVVFITSKVLAITQGRSVKIEGTDKSKLIKQEADRLVKKPVIAAGSKIYLTIKDNTLIPSSGIDESNGNGYYILWPKNTNAYLKKIHIYLTKKHGIKKLGVISTDSHTTPLRWGVTGISTGFYGIKPVKDLRGKKDIFGKKLKFTQANVVDALSVMAVLLMGEASEKTPMLIGRGLAMVEFTDKNLYKKFVIDPKKDIYRELLKPLRK